MGFSFILYIPLRVSLPVARVVNDCGSDGHLNLKPEPFAAPAAAVPNFAAMTSQHVDIKQQ